MKLKLETPDTYNEYTSGINKERPTFKTVDH